MSTVAGEGGNDRHRPRTALVLSGGGARGAYEAGFIRYLRTEVARSLGYQPCIDIVCGTSVGAINACYLAATMDRPERQARDLWELWAHLNIAQVFELSVQHLFKIPRWLLGGHGEQMSLLRSGALETLVRRSCPWPRISRNLRNGTLHALTVTATHVKSGTATVFVQQAGGPVMQWAAPGFLVSRSVRIGPWHALASAAIPLVFPAVRIGGDLFTDGGIRQNTPLLPAIALGAERVMVVSLRHRAVPPVPDLPAPAAELQDGVGPPLAATDGSEYPSAAFLFGKLLNALLLDQVEHDLHRLEKLNAMLDEAGERFGPKFVEQMGQLRSPFFGTSFRQIRSLYIRPGKDLGVIAAEYLDAAAHEAGRLAGQVLRRLSSGSKGSRRDDDLASYLMFHGPYCERLMAQAENDCRSQHDRLCEFFSSEGDRTESATD